MSNNSKQDNDAERITGQQSQDAQRHQQDAVHHKVHKSPRPSAADTQNARQAQRGPQNGDINGNDSDAGQQPEIPKVGSRDAPGG
jgi:hypothetical protein